MILVLQYNVNNHILDGVHHFWWHAFCQLVDLSVLRKDLLNSEPLCVILAPPMYKLISFGMQTELGV